MKPFKSCKPVEKEHCVMQSASNQTQETDCLGQVEPTDRGLNVLFLIHPPMLPRKKNYRCKSNLGTWKNSDTSTATQQQYIRSAGKQAALFNIIDQIRAAVYFWSGSQLLLSNGLLLACCPITRLHCVCCRSDGSAPLLVSLKQWSGSVGYVTRIWARLAFRSCYWAKPKGRVASLNRGHRGGADCSQRVITRWVGWCPAL